MTGSILDKYKTLRKSLDKHGQIHAIIKCQYGIIDGYKKYELLIDKKIKTVNLTVKNVNEYIELVAALQPVKLTSKEKKKYAIQRAKDFKRSGVPVGKIVPLIARLLRVSERQVQRYLPDEHKMESKARDLQTNVRKISPSKMKVISKIREQHDWLTSEDIQRGLRDPLYLLKLAERHFGSVRKVVDLDPIELEKLKAKLFQDKDFLREAHARYEEHLEQQKQTHEVDS